MTLEKENYISYLRYVLNKGKFSKYSFIFKILISEKTNLLIF